MKKAIVGKKIGMTQVFTDDGRLVPVTVVEAGPCKVVQKKMGLMKKADLDAAAELALSSR